MGRKLSLALYLSLIISLTEPYETLYENYRSDAANKDIYSNLHSVSQNPTAIIEGRSVKGIFLNLIEQLSAVLHRKFISSQNEAANIAEPRYLSEARKNGYYDNSFLLRQKKVHLPECATQQVCNAIYTRHKFSHKLCNCPPTTGSCSSSYSISDGNTIELGMKNSDTKAITLVKTCEPVNRIRDCREPRDWAILALQNIRTGKAHYLVICKCPGHADLNGPLHHNEPNYAQVPGIRVYGMMCLQSGKRFARSIDDPAFPSGEAEELLKNNAVITSLS